MMNTQLFIKKAPTVLNALATGMLVTNKALGLFDISGTALSVIGCVALSLRLIAWGIQTADRRGWIR